MGQGALAERHVVQHGGGGDLLAHPDDAGPQHEAFLFRVGIGEHLFQRLEKLVARDGGEEAQPPGVDAQDRNGAVFDEAGRRQHGAVPAEDHQHVGERGEVLLGIGSSFPDELGGGGIEQQVLAPSPQPGDEFLEEGLGIGRLRFDEDTDAFHGRRFSPDCS